MQACVDPLAWQNGKESEPRGYLPPHAEKSKLVCRLLGNSVAENRIFTEL